MKKQNDKEAKAENLSKEARSASALVNLWLEHPWVAHDLHERASSAWEQVVQNEDNKKHVKLRISEHAMASAHFAMLEANWKIIGSKTR